MFGDNIFYYYNVEQITEVSPTVFCGCDSWQKYVDFAVSNPGEVRGAQGLGRAVGYAHQWRRGAMQRSGARHVGRDLYGRQPK